MERLFQPLITQRKEVCAGMSFAHGEFIAGLVLSGWGLWFYLLASKFPRPFNPFDVGPATFPKLIATALIILGLTLSALAVRKFGSSGLITVKRKASILASILLFIVYALTIPLTGYYISTAFFIPAMLLLAGETRVLVLGATTALFLLFAFGIFDLLLGVPLPRIHIQG